MAVVSIYNRAFPDPALVPNLQSRDVDAMVRLIFADPTVTNGNSINSIIYFGRAPSHWRMLPSSVLITPGIAGATSVDLGLLDETAGTKLAAALAAAVDLSAAATKNVMAAVTTANANKRLWQLLGLTADPKRPLAIIGTLNAAATATGVVLAQLFFGTGP